MRITCGPDEELKRVTHIHPVGNLDAHGANHFWDVVSARVTDDTPSLLVDMRDIDLLTSAGVGILIRLLTRVQKAGGSLSLYGCSSKAKRVLEVISLEGILNARETEEEARAVHG
jgi:anti-anti-sigma factor